MFQGIPGRRPDPHVRRALHRRRRPVPRVGHREQHDDVLGVRRDVPAASAVPDGDRLVSISGRHPETGRRVTLTLDDVRELTAGVASLEAVAAYAGRTATLIDGGDARAHRRTAGDCQPLSDTRHHAAARRRLRVAADDTRRPRARSLISDSLWRRRYQADPNVSGASFASTTTPHIIAGVMPPEFRFPSTSEMWIPFARVWRRGAAIARRFRSSAGWRRA